jgi:hypothetical protein
MHDFVQIEYEAMRAEERDRMNARTAVWTLFLTIVGAFGFAVGISSASPYLGGAVPPLLLFLARHTRHSEDVLRQIRAYLYQLEKANNYAGYEHYTRGITRSTHGSHKTALRDAFLLTDILAVVSTLSRLTAEHAPLLGVISVLLTGIVAMMLTWRTLSASKKRARTRASPIPTR